MAKSRNDILWRFLADTKSLDKGNKTAQSGFKATNKASSAMQSGIGLATKAFGALGLAMGGREILQWGADAVKAANDYDESVNAVAVVTGHAADEIAKLGEDSAEAFALTKTELNEAAVAFAGFGQQVDADNYGQVFEDYATRAADFASVMNIDVSEAMSLFQSTLAGESEPIRRYGKNMSAAAVEAHAVAVGIIAAGDAMTDQQKVQARYSLLMAETADVQGDFADTADSAANKSKILAKRFADLQMEVGRKLQPAFEDALDTASALIPVLEGLAHASSGLFREVSTLSGGMTDLVGGGDGGVLGAANAFARLSWEQTKFIPGLNGLDRSLRELGYDLGVVNDGVRDMSDGFRQMSYENAARGLSSVAYEAWQVESALGDATVAAEGLDRALSNAAARNASLANVSRFVQGGVVSNVNDAQAIRDLIDLGAISGG